MTTIAQHRSPVVRALRAADAGAIHRIAGEYDLARFGRLETKLVDVTPERPGSTRNWYGAELDGRLLVVGNVGWSQGEVGVEAEIIGPPTVDRGVWARLFDELRSDARTRYPGRPLHFFVDDDYADWLAWAEGAGAHEVRRFYRMAMDFDSPPAAPPSLPSDISIRTVDGGEADLRTVFGIVDTAFRDHWGAEGDSDYAEFIAHACAEGRYDPTLWWIAEVAGTPAATLIGRGYDDVGHVGTLGTLREFRGRGLARALLLTSFDEFFRRGCAEVSLGVDATNPTGALRLYESVGMRPSVTWVCYELPSIGPSPAGSSTSASKNV